MNQIRAACFPADIPALRQLFLGYIEALCTEMPENRDAITQKYSPEAVEAWLLKFEQLHRPPLGALLIAWKGETPLACGMLRSFAPGIAEVQRLYVTPAARGLGLARQISLDLMDHARSNGFHTIRLDTARPLTAAIALYRSLGFKERSPYHTESPQMDHFILYFERPL